MISRSLHVLVIERSSQDAKILEQELRLGGFDPQVERVETEPEMRSALAQGQWDLILSDYLLTQFGALQALAILKESGLDIPFIVVSGTGGHYAAAECIKAGAQEFLTQTDLTRFPAVIEKQLLETASRRQLRQAANHLAESEGRFRSLFDNMLEGFAYCKMLFEGSRPIDFVYLEVNKAFETLTGLKDVAGRRVSEVIPGIRAADPELFEIYGRVALTGVPERFEMHVTTLGQWFSISVYSPRKEHFVAVFDVITERKMMEQSLRKSEEDLKLAISIGRLGTWDWDLLSDKATWSEQCAAILGMSHEAGITYDRFIHSLHPDDRDRINLLVRGAREKKSEYEAEFRVIWADGTVHWVAARGRFFYDSSGRAVRMVGVARDITERRQAEEQIKKLFSAVEHTPDTVVITDTNGFIEYVNPAFEKLTGYSKAEVIGRTPALLKSEKHEEEFYQQLWKTILSGQEFKAEFINRKKTGELYHHEATIAPIKESNGRITHFVLGGRDVTRRKEIEDHLKRLTAIIEATSDFVAMTDPQGKILYVNRAGRKMVGLLLDDDLSAVSIASTHPQWAGDLVLKEAIPAAIRDGFWIGETVFLSSDGREIPTSQLIMSHRDAHGNVAFVSTVARDISEMKRAERALMESEEKYRTLFQESRDAIFVSTPEGQFLDMNPAGLNLLGIPSLSELVQIDIARDLYFNAEDRKIYQSVLDQQGYVQDYEQTLRARDGKKLTVLETSSAIRDESGKVVAYRGTMRDVTHLKQLQHQFLQSQKMETIGRLTGGVAHDFNNILMAISGYCELLLMKLGQENPLRMDIQEILKAQRQGASLTRQLLAFSRKQVLTPKVFDLNAVVSNMEGMLQRLIGEDIDLMIVTSNDLELVEADPGQIEQVIMNLAVNSRDAMPRGGRLTLEVSHQDVDEEYVQYHMDAKQGPHVMLSVTDSGHGMDQETLSHLFEPFFTTKDKDKGTGLGLATIYGIVTQSQGSISVYSELDHGTTFKILLPRIGGGRDKTTPEWATASLKGGSETILLVDDNDTIRSAVGELARTHGYKILLAGSGKEALETSRNHSGAIDLLVTDVVMPEMSGQELARQLSAQRPGIKVLYMSGYTDDSVFRHGILNSHSAFLQKPVPMATLLLKIRELLDQRKTTLL